MIHRNLFSVKQIDRCNHLLTEHGYNAEKIAEVMGTSLNNAQHLINQVEKKYPRIKHIAQKQEFGKRYVADAKTDDLIKKIPETFKRPPAIYSNKRFYDLI